MTYPGPRNPEENFPERAIARIEECKDKEANNNETSDENISPRELLLLVVAALRVLKREDGSTMNEIRRILVGGGFITPSLNIRPALISGLKRNVIRRPLSAVKAGTYDRYVEVNSDVSGRASLKRQTKRARVCGKRVKRCNKTDKKSAERYRLAL
ncbi:hypothetical protein EGW08_014898 [Elysia chlorotica]|uniref:H15 domain-containing protein n=1 Tax=Elysia chlorotica TaxID=188477 RepID=A0A433T7B3_ELYCH|nr:hypothetical protein EGW08_014898 [Elysia chlorotica]